jgi:phage tail sheath gpL-like
VSTAVVAIATATLFAGPAAGAEKLLGAGCPDVPLVQPFAPWQDHADYMLAPDGDIEAGAGSWALTGGAAAVEGSEPFAIGAAGDHLSLALPAGSTATTAPMCIAEEHDTMRFLASGPASGTLVVRATFTKADGSEKTFRLGAIDGSGTWAASDVLRMRVDEKADKFGGSLSVTLSFTPRGDEAWQIDGVYVDPYRSK